MGKRSTGRKLAMQALYQSQLRKATMDVVLSDFLEDSSYPEDTRNWANELARSTWKKRDEMDDLITKYSENWELSRINAVDRSVLRMAFYELRYTKTAPSVVLNEAIELVKRFSTEDSPKFINGILGNYVKLECLQD